MKAPPKRKGNLRWLVRACSANLTLNESPSEKEGKFEVVGGVSERGCPSMIVPRTRKGNNWAKKCTAEQIRALNESPSEKEGKYTVRCAASRISSALNESPSEKEGK